MQFQIWSQRWKLLLMLLVSLSCLQCHMFHYLHLKKFITAVAFARALGKKPTVLPIPIPIPIPIAQNEVIKIPMGSNNAKTTILDGSKGSDHANLIAHLLGGGSSSSYTGSSSYGYATPGISSSPSVINLSQLKSSDSNIVNTLTSALGGNGGQTKVLILGGQNTGGGTMAASPSVIQLSSVPGFNAMPGGNIMGLGGGLNLGANYGLSGSTLGLHGMNIHGGGLNYGSGFGDMGLSSSPGVYMMPLNMHSGKPRRRLPFKYGGRNMRSGKLPYSQKGNASYECDNCHQSSNNGKTVMRDAPKRPIPIGEKFSYRP